MNWSMIDVISCRYVWIALICICISPVAIAQKEVTRIRIDSIPRNQYVRILYNPKDSETGPLAFDLFRSKVDTYYISLALPVIWIGINHFRDEPLDVTGPLLSKINELVSSGEWVYIQPDEFPILRYPDQFGAVHNSGQDLVWDSLFLDIFNGHLSATLSDALRIQQVNLASYARVFPGCYRVHMKPKKLHRARRITLNRSVPDVQDLSKDCYWCFLRDRMIMSGPCFDGTELSYFWKLRQEIGYYTLCLFSDEPNGSDACSFQFYITSYTDNNTIYMENSPFNTCNPPSLLESPALLPAKGQNAVVD